MTMLGRLARGGCVVILIALTACDNVRWGGADIAIVSPPPRATAAHDVDPGDIAARLPAGPLLYFVQRAEDGARLKPVAEIDTDSLLPLRPGDAPEVYGTRFIAEHLRQGAEFVLFSGGVRVGTLVVRSAGMPDRATCPLLPEAAGDLELVEGLEDVHEMLALARIDAPQVPRRIGAPAQPTRSMQVIAPILAERVMRARRAPLPASWPRAMAQLRPFPYSAAGEMGFAATFLVGDTLGPGLNNEGHSTFIIGGPRTASFDTTYVDFTSYQQQGKRAPRVVDFLDWNRSGSVELLLEVYSVDDQWFEAIGRDTRQQWRRIFDGRC
jgi:hypothetical protein